MDAGKGKVIKGKPRIDPATLLERWRRLPPIDPDELRRDIDSIIDPSL